MSSDENAPITIKNLTESSDARLWFPCAVDPERDGLSVQLDPAGTVHLRVFQAGRWGATDGKSAGTVLDHDTLLALTASLTELAMLLAPPTVRVELGWSGDLKVRCSLCDWPVVSILFNGGETEDAADIVALGHPSAHDAQDWRVTLSDGRVVDVPVTETLR